MVRAKEGGGGAFTPPPQRVHFLPFLRLTLAFFGLAGTEGASGVAAAGSGAAGDGVPPSPPSSHWTNIGIRARLGVPRWEKSPGSLGPPAERGDPRPPGSQCGR